MRASVAVAALFAGVAVAAPGYTNVVTQTDVQTITSCPPEVSSCPGKPTSTYYPTTANANATVPLTTKVVYSTQLITVTKCPQTVTVCPAASTVVETSIIPLYTTVCPVTEVESSPVYTPPASSTGYAHYPTESAYYPIPSSSSAYHSGTGVPVAPSQPPAFTGAANSVNAGMAVAGLGAIAALFL